MTGNGRWQVDRAPCLIRIQRMSSVTVKRQKTQEIKAENI